MKDIVEQFQPCMEFKICSQAGAALACSKLNLAA